MSMLLDAARRGAFVELDSVGAPHQPQADLVRTVIALIEAGFIDRILLSHDAGWYNPARSDGLPDEGYRGYTALMRDFIPALLQQGVTEEQVNLITVDNPANAFAF
jgi:phosphotriesterase-related protein